MIVKTWNIIFPSYYKYPATSGLAEVSYESLKKVFTSLNNNFII